MEYETCENCIRKAKDEYPSGDGDSEPDGKGKLSHEGLG